ncbi:hypothetical protein RND81_09G190100 [Saponaria officinalis]|uniref:Reverse transcriptase domain-containing protein n=1 Tax=Saponaria officinalis TaxID=3572 RepID=A0AAW1INL6_SAPOF
MLLVDFQNAFNMVDRECMLREVSLRCPVLSRWVAFCYGSPARLYYGEHCLLSCQGVQQGDPLGPLLFALVLHPLVCKIRDSFDLTLQAWYLDDGTIVGDTLVVSKVLELIMKEGPRCGLVLNVDKSEVFWPCEDPRSRVEGVFPPAISRPARGVKVLGAPVSSCSAFRCELVLKRAARTIELMDSLARLDDPQCELLLLRVCTGISKLYFALRTCTPSAFRAAQLCFDASLRSSLERIVVASGPGFGDWQWRQATLPFSFGGLGVYAAGDVVHYAFLVSRVQTEVLQGALLTRAGVSGPGVSFDDAVRSFVEVTCSDFFRGREIAAPRLMKTLADIYFTSVVGNAESGFSLSPRQVALWRSQQESHATDWLRVVPISGLGQVMNGRTYRCVLGYRLGIPMFLASRGCSACSRTLDVDVFGDHAVSCSGVVGLKHRHNLVRDTLLDICSCSGISAAKEVDIGLVDREGKPLLPADVLLYSWDGGKDVCVDLTGSSPLTQAGLADFRPGRVIADAVRRKRAKYHDLCSSKGYGFLPFSFSSLGGLDADAVALLKRIQKFALSQDACARAAPFIFSRLCFAIARGVGAQLVSRLPTNFL